MQKYIILIIVLILFYYFNANYENFHTAYIPYELENINLKDISYGYPSYYTPVDEKCKKENCNIENFRITGYKSCAPLCILTLYTSSFCPYCSKAKVEWNKFKNHIKNNCAYSKLVKLVHKEDNNIGDATIEVVPTVTLMIKEDKINKVMPKIIEYVGDITAENLENFIIENMPPKHDYDYRNQYYIDCKKKKLHNKYSTLC